MTGQGASRVNSTRATRRAANIASTALTIGAMLGIAERGPIGSYVLVTSFEEYQAVFGAFTANAQDLPLAVKAAFEEGENGKGLERLLIGRVVHTTTPGDPTTKTSAAATLNLMTAATSASSGAVTSAVGPFLMNPGDTLVIDVDGGGDQTFTISATAANKVSGSGPFALANGQQLQFALDGGSTLTKTFATGEFVSIGAATPTEVVNSLNAFLAAQGAGGVASVVGSTVKITSNRKGTGSGVNVIGGTANTGLAFATGNTAGTGNVSNTTHILASELATIFASLTGAIASAVSNALHIASSTTGGSSSILVKASSTGAVELGFDSAVHSGSSGTAVATMTVNGKTDGTYANAISLRVSAASSGLATEFNLALLEGGVITESWFNLSLDPTSPRYAPEVLSVGASGQPASNLIAAVDLDVGIVPAAGTFGPLTGGGDGLVGLADTDFTGGTTTNGATGLRVFDKAQRIDALAVPGRATSAVHNGIVTYCEVNRAGRTWFELDPPASLTYQQIITYVTQTALLEELSEIGEIHWPRVAYDNPDAEIFGNGSTVWGPPSGMKMGILARVDAAKVGGAFTHPAGVENGFSRTVRDVESDDVRDEAKRGLVFDALINPVRIQDGKPPYVDGARTLKSTGAFPTVGESRGVMFTQNQIADALDDQRQKNITPRLISEEASAVDKFLAQLTAAECFASTKPAEAYFVDFGAALNNAATNEARETNGRYGMATTKPNEFVNVEAVPFTPGQVAAQAGI